MPHNWLKEYADYYEEVLTNYRAKYHILSAHRLSRRIALQKYLELHHIKYPDPL
ncbi:3478_t:CDS:2, partial [Gigaspora margarita]